MPRLFLIFIFVAVIILSVIWLGRALKAVQNSTQEARLPDTVKTVSYLLLLALMFGVVTGWLAGL